MREGRGSRLMAKSGKGETLLFGIVDTARDERLYELTKGSTEKICLFAGELAEPLKRAAPYLCVLAQDEPLFNAWRDEGWGRSWGITFRSAAALSELRKQFRKCLQAMLPDGTVALFRFYDPRVWRTYLPSCEPTDLQRWFLLVEEYQVETEDGMGSVRYRMGPEGLLVQ
jgi:hypothetical protein